MKHSTPPSVDLLWEKYSYNPLTGYLHKRKSGIRVKGYVSSNRRGWMLNLTWNGKRLVTSYGRIVYAWCTGAWPTQQIDHIDRNPQNNTFHNLRNISNRENCQNRANFGHWVEREQKWQARIRVNGKLKYLGLHATQALAQQAYREACETYELPHLLQQTPNTV